MNYLLDTHILVWWISQSQKLSNPQKKILDAVSPETPLGVSDITLWEITTLYSLGRISLQLPLRAWLERATAAPLVRRLAITPTIAAETAALPPSFHKDPADRIIVATSRIYRTKLLTKDKQIIAAGMVATIS